MSQQTMIRAYKYPDAFNKDARKLGKKGWTVQHTMERSPSRSFLFKITFGLFTLLFPKRKEIVVTYVKTA